jgi:peptidoglycan/LPS O-acetylase OafA/YrhL
VHFILLDGTMTPFPLALGPGKFRVLLAVLVVFSHLSFVEIGRPAVFAFFMLSGYWVLRMYQQKYATSGPVWIFYLSRFLRIWPAFASAFLLAFVAFALWGAAKPFGMLAGLPLLGIASTKRDVLGTAWSLDIELQFYLLLPLLSALLLWIGRSRRGFAAMAVICAALTGLGWVLQLHFGVWTVFSYLPSFVLGVLIWHLRLRPSGRQALFCVGVFLAIGVFVALTPYLRPLLLRDVESPFNEDWFGMAWVAVLTPLVIWNVQQKSTALDLHLGNYSYALYITHWPIIALMRPALQPLSLLDRGGIVLVAFVVSLIFYLMVDRGWESLRRRMVLGAWRRPI